MTVAFPDGELWWDVCDECRTGLSAWTTNPLNAVPQQPVTNLFRIFERATGSGFYKNVRTHRSFIRIVKTGEADDFPSARSGIEALRIS